MSARNIFTITVIIIGLAILIGGIFLYYQYSRGKFQQAPTAGDLDNILSDFSSTTKECLKQQLSDSVLFEIFSGRRLAGPDEQEKIKSCGVDVGTPPPRPER